MFIKCIKNLYLDPMKQCIFLGLCLVIISCQHEPKMKSVTSTNQQEPLNVDSLIKFEVPNLVFKDSTIEWRALSDFHKRLLAVKEVQTMADLRLLTEELIELEQALESTEKPALFHTDAINSRLILIKTYLLQLQAYIEIDDQLTQKVNQLIEAHHSLIHKINRIERASNAPNLSKDALE